MALKETERQWNAAFDFEVGFGMECCRLNAEKEKEGERLLKGLEKWGERKHGKRK